MADPTVVEKSIASTFPKGSLAWSGMQSGSMREFSDGLAVDVNRQRLDGQGIIKDFFPFMTTLIKEWEDTFRLPTGEFLSQEQRIDRLIASWTKKSPASYTGMNEIYALSGLPVVARPLEPGEDPRIIAAEGQPVTVYVAVTGNARTGQLSAFSRCGGTETTPATTQPKIFADGRPGETSKNYITVCGSSRTGQLSDSSRCGNFQGSKQEDPVIVIPDDVWTWPLIYIIEGADGEFAKVPMELKDAFEFLTYKIKPQFMWAIARIEYV